MTAPPEASWIQTVLRLGGPLHVGATPSGSALGRGRTSRSFPQGLLSVAFALLAALPAPGQERLLALQPLGKVEPKAMAEVQKHLEQVFACRLETLPIRPVPKEAFYPPRSRYRGTAILDVLAREADRRFRVVLGLTSVDVSMTKGEFPDWGVYGVAYLSRRPAVVSTFRLHKGGATRELFLRRLRVVATHEVGHTLGLDHCATPHCLMEDAKGTIKTVDGSTGVFCPGCAARLGGWLRGGT